MSVADDLHWLKLHLAWGADEALGSEPIDRLVPAGTGSAPHVTDPPAPAADGGGPRRSNAPATPISRPVPAAPRSNASVAAALANEASTLASLEHAVAGFSLCALRDTAGALAFGDGPADADIVLVIDAPSAEDDATGIPLSGALGAFFGEVLASVGISRDAIRVATLVPWRPPGDRPANAAEIACCLPFLLAHLRLVHPCLVLVAGSAGTRTLTGSQGSARAMLGTFRAIAIDGRPDPIPAFVLPGPAQLHAETRIRKATWEALLALRIRLDDGTPLTITNP